ncbi:MAG: hypothetical protein ACO3YM_05040, partial [Candidatus Kapaibacteriota bacterium]
HQAMFGILCGQRIAHYIGTEMSSKKTMYFCQNYGFDRICKPQEPLLNKVCWLNIPQSEKYPVHESQEDHKVR